MNKSFHFYIFVIICILNSIKGPIGIPDTLGSLFTLYIIFISIISLIKIHRNKLSCIYIKGLDIMLVLFTIYGIEAIINNRQLFVNGSYLATYNFLLTHWLSLMPIYTFYYYRRKGILTKKRITYAFIIILLASIFRFFNSLFSLRLSSLSGDVVVSSAYSLLPLFPLLFLSDLSNKVKILLLSFISILIIIGMKRGAILIAALMFILYFFKLVNNVSRKTKYSILFLGLIVLLISSYYIYQIYLDNPFLQMRWEQTLEGNSSGRDNIYSTYWEYYRSETSQFHFIFGAGGFATVDIFGQYAHNDWIEIAINMGLIGLIGFFLYWYLFIKELVLLKNKEIKNAFLGIFIIYFLMTLFSMSISAIEYSAALCIGYCLCSQSQYHSNIS